MRLAVYPGSFDPITNGHMDIVMRASAIFDELIVAIANNPNKKALFTIEERLDLARTLTAGIPNVSIESFDALLVDYVSERGVNVVVRGLRAVTDFEMEFQMALINKTLRPQVETIFMVSSAEFSFLSSSIIKEVAMFGGDVKNLVSPEVVRRLKEKFGGVEK
jgi:pantetheine-phosphate adenylyltransferase